MSLYAHHKMPVAKHLKIMQSTRVSGKRLAYFKGWSSTCMEIKFPRFSWRQIRQLVFKINIRRQSTGETLFQAISYPQSGLIRESRLRSFELVLTGRVCIRLIVTERSGRPSLFTARFCADTVFHRRTSHCNFFSWPINLRFPRIQHGPRPDQQNIQILAFYCRTLKRSLLVSFLIPEIMLASVST